MTRSNSLATATGKGAAPDTHAMIDFRSNFATSGCSLTATYRRGTPGNSVGFSCCVNSRIMWMSRGLGIGISFAAISTERFIASSP